MEQQVIDSMVAPKDESKYLVMQWLESAGLGRKAILSPRLDSVVVEATVGEVERLLKTKYSSFGMFK
jgi:tripeptidyl-peptidase-1